MFRHDGTDAKTNASENNPLLTALNDVNQSFTKEELARVIRNEFFNDDKKLDSEVVDAALKRIMSLDGEAINEQTLQTRRETMMKDVFRELLGMDDAEDN